MPQIKIKDPNVGEFDMPWEDSTRLPTDADVDDYISKNFNKSTWQKINTPLAPEGTPAKSRLTDAYRVQHPNTSLALDTVGNVTEDAYNKLIRPVTSPLGIGVTALTAGAGATVGMTGRALKAGAGLVLGGLGVKQAGELPDQVRKAYNEPNAENIADATIGAGSTILMGAGAGHLAKSSLSRPVRPPVTTTPEAPFEAPKVTVPKGVTVRMRPGFEDVLTEGPDDTVIVQDVERFKQGATTIKGPDTKVKQLAEDLKGVQPSTDYNAGYNPDAIIRSQVTPEKPQTTEGAFADWTNGRAAAKWTRENIKRLWSALDEKYNPSNKTTLYRWQSEKGSGVPDWVKDDPNYVASKGAEGRWFTDDPDDISFYKKDALEKGKLVKLELSAEEAAKHHVSNNPEAARFSAKPNSEYFLPRELADTALPESKFSAFRHPLVKLQEALRKGEEPELERYTNQLHEEARSAGVRDRQLQLGYKEDYLPQMWENAPEEVSAAFKETRRLGTKPAFSLKSLFKDYQQGIEAGLTPKFNTPSELIASYAAYVDKFVADKNFFDRLRLNGDLKTKEQLGTDFKNWEALDPKRTPVQRYVTSTEEGSDTHVTREYYAKKNVAKAINDYLQGPDTTSTLGKAGQINNAIKSGVMTSGIPGTALNIHGVNVGVGRMWQAGGLKMVTRYLRLALDPNAATEATKNNLYDAPRFVRAGLKFTPEFEKRVNSPDASMLEKAGTAKHNLLERPLFGQVLPELQLELAQTIEKEYLKRGLEPKLAERLAAHDANNFASNLNTTELMRDNTTRSLASAISFAPQWLESHWNLAKGVAKALSNPADPQGYLYRKATGQVLKAYLTVGLINTATSGKFDPFHLHLGKDSQGNPISVPLMGSGDDWIKLPLEVAGAVLEGKGGAKIADLTRGRLASTAQFFVNFVTKQKAQGGNLFTKSSGKPLSGAEQVENVGELAARTMAPRWAVSVPGAVLGKNSPEQAIGDITGLQLRTQKTKRVKPPF